MTHSCVQVPVRWVVELAVEDVDKMHEHGCAS